MFFFVVGEIIHQLPLAPPPPKEPPPPEKLDELELLLEDHPPEEPELDDQPPPLPPDSIPRQMNMKIMPITNHRTKKNIR